MRWRPFCRERNRPLDPPTWKSPWRNARRRRRLAAPVFCPDLKTDPSSLLPEPLRGVPLVNRFPRCRISRAGVQPPGSSVLKQSGRKRLTPFPRSSTKVQNHRYRRREWTVLGRRRQRSQVKGPGATRPLSQSLYSRTWSARRSSRRASRKFTSMRMRFCRHFREFIFRVLRCVSFRCCARGWLRFQFRVPRYGFQV
jgi:hypothetical protein